MQQLTIQFEGYADEYRQPIDVSATTRRSVKLVHLLPGWAMKQDNPSQALARVMGNLKLFAQGALCVAFGFGLMFLAAIIGG